MKYLLTLLLFLSGCSEKNAFTHFDMTKEQELGVSNLKGAKIIKNDGSTAGVLSTVYLSKVYPTMYNDNEYFYIYMYLKKPKIKLSIKLNGKKPIETQVLNPNNSFTRLTSVQNDWTDYYLVTFAKDTNDTANLSFESDQSLPVLLKYLKDE